MHNSRFGVDTEAILGLGQSDQVHIVKTLNMKSKA